MEKDTIFDKVRENIDNYTDSKTTIGKYVEWSLYDTIETIDAYINSKHISGETDHLGREKPFFNIVTAASNIWFRATDLDRKNIKLKPIKKSDVLLSFIANIHLQRYMNKSNFGQFLNNWGRSLSKYGSSVVKFVEKDGELHTSVIPWNRLIVDSVDFNADVVIEKLYLSPSQLRQNNVYDQKIVKELIDAKTTRKTPDGIDRDNKDNYIEIYEVHGQMPLSWITKKDGDSDKFTQQVQIISFMLNEKDGTYSDYTIYSGKEEKSPYMITHLIEEDGRVLSIGAVENLFNAQWMINHSHKLIKDQLDLASKLIFQTSDENFVGQNILTAIETGDILRHAINQPLTQVANNSHDIAPIQNFATSWQIQAKEANGISEAMMGVQKSGTAWRQTEAVLQESHDLFETMIENKGLALEQMLRTYIIPFIKKKMNTSDEISATLSEYGIKNIETAYINNEIAKISNKIKKDTILSGKIFEGLDMDSIKGGVESSLQEQGEQRFFKPSDVSDITWSKLLENYEWEVEVEITNENKDSLATLTTLNTLLQTIMAKQGMPFSEEEKLVFNKILSETGVVSSMELDNIAKAKPVQQIPQAQIPQIQPTTTT